MWKVIFLAESCWKLLEVLFSQGLDPTLHVLEHWSSDTALTSQQHLRHFSTLDSLTEWASFFQLEQETPLITS